MPSKKYPKPLVFQYDIWDLIQTTDGFGYPTFRLHYKAFDTPTPRGWLNNSGEKWDESNHILAMKEHPAEEISADLEDNHPGFPDETFMWHLATGAPSWSLRRMMQNPELYGDLKLDHKRCGEVMHENSGKILAQHKKGPKRRNDSDLRLGIHLPGVCMHADLA